MPPPRSGCTTFRCEYRRLSDAVVDGLGTIVLTGVADAAALLPAILLREWAVVLVITAYSLIGIPVVYVNSSFQCVACGARGGRAAFVATPFRATLLAVLQIAAAYWAIDRLG